MTTVKAMYAKGYKYLTSVCHLTLRQQLKPCIPKNIGTPDDSHAFFEIVSVNGYPPDEALIRKCMIQINWGELRGIVIHRKELDQTLTHIDQKIESHIFLGNGETHQVDLIVRVDYVFLGEESELSHEDLQRVIKYYATFWTDGRMPKKIIQVSCLNEDLLEFYSKCDMTAKCDAVGGFMGEHGFQEHRGLEKEQRPKDKVFLDGDTYEVITEEPIGQPLHPVPNLVTNFNGIEASGLGVDVEYDPGTDEITNIEMVIEGRNCVFHIRPDHTLRDLADSIMREAMRPAVRALIHDALYLFAPPHLNDVDEHIQITPRHEIMRLTRDQLDARSRIIRRNRGDR